MPFGGQIPALFLEGASGSSVLEVFARNLFANLDTGEVYLRSGDRSPILLWPAKRGDQIPVQIRFVNEELDGADELIALPEGWGITVEGHLVVGGVAQYGGPVMIRQTLWAQEDAETDPHYDAVIDFETTGMSPSMGSRVGMAQGASDGQSLESASILAHGGGTARRPRETQCNAAGT